MLGHYFKKYRSLANGLALSGSSIGTFAIPPLLQFCLDNFQLQGTVLLIGGLYLNICVCGSLYRPTEFYVRERKDGKNSQKHEEENVSPENVAEREELLQNDAHNELKNPRLGELTNSRNLVMGSMESLHAETFVQAQNKEEKQEVQEGKCTAIYRFIFEKVIPLEVLKIPVVIFFTFVSFFVFFGYFNFIIFMPGDLVTQGIVDYEKALLLSVAGIGDLIGRITIGIVGNLNFIKRYKILGFCCVACGCQIVIFGFATTYWWKAIHVGLYGFLGGGYVAINAIVVIDFVGLKLMPKALGMVLFIQGLGAAIGQPVEGKCTE